MTSSNDDLLDSAVRAALVAEGFKNYEVRRILRILDREVLPDLGARLVARLENIAIRGFDAGTATTSRLRFLYRDLRGFFEALDERLRAETDEPLVGFAGVQASGLASEMRREVAGIAKVRAPTAAAVRSAVLGRPFEGALLRERWAGRARAMRLKVEGQVRIGIAIGETPQQIVSRVRAIWPAERRHVAVMVRAAVAHAQAQARQATYEENADLIRGVMWVATLDTGTCPVCGALDGTVFSVDEGQRPPAHFGCRCTTVPVLRSAAALGGTRASLDGQVPDSTTFAEWIARQSAERQDEVFGPGRAALFRAGRIDLDDMVDAAGHTVALKNLVI